MKKFTSELIKTGVDLDSMSNQDFVDLIFTRIIQDIVMETVFLWGVK